MTDQELEIVLENIDQVRKCHYELVQVEDYIDQIGLMSKIMDGYGHLFPAHDDLQIRMIGRMAKQGSEILRQAEEKLDEAIGDISRIARDIQLERLSKQDTIAPQCSICRNQSQVTTMVK